MQATSKERTARNHGKGLTLLAWVIVMATPVALAGTLAPMLPGMLGREHGSTSPNNIHELNKLRGEPSGGHLAFDVGAECDVVGRPASDHLTLADSGEDESDADASLTDRTKTAEATKDRDPAADSANKSAEEPASDGSGTLIQPQLTPEMAALRTKVRQALEIYYTRQLNSRDHSPWSIMHSLIGYGVDTQLHVGGPGGRRVNAIGWLCFNGSSAGQRLFYLF